MQATSLHVFGIQTSLPRWVFLVIALSTLPALSWAQPFDSGSDGSDGALALTTPGVVVFDPVVLGLDSDGDGVYHFTTITIDISAIVQLRSEVLGTRPVIWLAQNDIVIDGTLRLQGEEAFDTPGLARGGAGGFDGGAGLSPTRAAQPGAGPGGGLPGSLLGSPGGGAGHVLEGGGTSCSPPDCGDGGEPYGNSFLQPLLGGSGGAGAGGTTVNGVDSGRPGGGGGGAILLASSTRIALNGSIVAYGGGGEDGSGGGSGGSARLVAPTVEGGGSIDVRGGPGGVGNETGGNGSAGRVRIESYDPPNFSIDPAEADVRYATPGNVLPSAEAPFVRIAAIDGVAAPASPSGSYAPADVTVDAAGPITIALEASNIPLGTEIQLRLNSEDEGALEVTSTPLVGTVEASTATATISLPPGFSRFTLSATWTP